MALPPSFENLARLAATVWRRPTGENGGGEAPKKRPPKEKVPERRECENRKIKSISEEMYKRLILPFYTLIISLIAASLIIEPKSKFLSKFHKLNIFLIGVSVIILSQISLKFVLNSISLIYLTLLSPLILVLVYYFLLLIITKFKLSFL